MDPTGGILSYVVNKLGDLVLGEVALLGNTRRDLQWVQGELRIMQSFLHHVAALEIHDARIAAWTEDVRRLAFHAEDVVDTFSLHAGNPTRRSFLSCCVSRAKSRHDFGTEIAQLRETVAELSARKATYDVKIPDGTSAGAVDRADELLRFRRLMAAPYVGDRDVVGLDGHVKAVTEMLVLGGSRRSVVSIVGMGGLGKTTLAKKVYNNVLGSSLRFDCTAWVDVSQKYSVVDLLKKIAEDTMKLSPEDVARMNQDTVTGKLCEFLHSRKYLIVLDDVWTSELWDTLGTILPDPNNGSRMITTTRNVEVARSANSRLSPYELSALGEEESRVLFTKKAFPDEDDPEQCCSGEIAGLRELIVKKCGGLPLALVVVGGLLSRKGRSVEEWSEVARKIDWEKTRKGEQCMGILALSYTDLPAHLRWCFLYLASLPEDCQASTKHLQRLWIAEGFVDKRAGESLEETAEMYLQELAQRCFIQLVRGTNLEERTELRCRVHDLLLDLAVSEAKKLRFLDVWRNPSDGSPGVLLRHLSITAYDHGQLPLESNKLRTLLIMNRWNWDQGEISGLVVGNESCNIKWSSLRGSLKLVRVLELAVGIDGLPEAIGEMANLRYLALSGDKIEKLPESVGNLQQLQTLDVGSTGIVFLPNSIWRIRTLRYLRGGIYTRFPMPKSSLPDGTLGSLAALRFLRVDPWMAKILQILVNLKELELTDVQNLPMATLSDVVRKLQQLNVLILSASADGDTFFEIDDIFSSSDDSHPHLHSLELEGFSVALSQLQGLPQNLAEVYLYSCKIDCVILRLLGNLKHLHLLKLARISFTKEDAEEEMVFRAGWFPQLQVLHLANLGIKSWELEEGCLRLLGELCIEGCSDLEALPAGLRHIGTLKAFALVDGSLRLRQRLQEPRDGRREGEDWHKIKHIGRVDIYFKKG